MIKKLRKRHLQIWILWAFLLPVGIMAGWLAVPERVTDKLLQPDQGIILPVKIQSIEKENYTVSLRSNEERTQYGLEWINKKVSTAQSSLIYKQMKPGNELVGRVEARGTYYFPLSMNSSGIYNFILYDIIKKKSTDTINFKTPL